MLSELKNCNAFSLNTDRRSIASLSKFLVLFLVVMASLCEYVAGVWSVEAMERWKERKVASSLSPGQTAEDLKYYPKVAVFYGNRQERRKNRECEKLKCKFLATGCVRADGDPPPFSCHGIWFNMTQTETVGECPYKPCEGYNQNGTCVQDEASCRQSQGTPIHFGLCNNYQLCCQFPGKS